MSNFPLSIGRWIKAQDFPNEAPSGRTSPCKWQWAACCLFMSRLSPRPTWSVCLSARLLRRALPWILTMQRQVREEPGGAEGLPQEVTAAARRQDGEVRGAGRIAPAGGGRRGVHPSVPPRRLLNVHDQGRSAIAWRWGWDGARAAGENRAPGPQRWPSPVTHAARGGRRAGGGQQSCSATAGSLPRPPPPPSTPVRGGHTHCGRAWLCSPSRDPGEDAPAPSAVPSRDQQRRGVSGVLSSHHPSHRTGPSQGVRLRASGCRPPVAWLSPKHGKEHGPRG